MVDSFNTRTIGVIIIVISLPGLYFNISVFHHFLSIEKTSFYILCMSKTISNSFILLVNILFGAPSAILYRIIGPDWLNGYLCQAIGFGIYMLGPLTQTLVSINRFLVVYLSPTKSSSYSNPITVVILIVFWLISIFFTTMPGLPDSCRVKLILDPLGWSVDYCSIGYAYYFFQYFLHLIISLGIVSNALNLLVVIKLALSACKAKSLSSESSRRRHKTTVRLFIQSCIQDWIYVFDMINGIWLTDILTDKLHILGIGLYMAVQGADGFVMYMFNRKSEKRKVSTVTVTPKLSKSQL